MPVATQRKRRVIPDIPHMHALPFDLQVVILQWVYRLSQSDAVDLQTLSTSALVCTSWTPTAQRLLFRRIPAIFRTPGRRPRRIPTRLLVATLRAKPVLGTYVRNVILPAGSSGVEDHIALLGLCPALSMLSIFNPVNAIGWGRFGIIARLHARPTVLTVSCATPKAIAEMLDLWPSVRYLRVSTLLGQTTPPFPPLSGMLHSVSIERDMAPEYLPWFLSYADDASALCAITVISQTPDIPAYVLKRIRSAEFLGTVDMDFLQKLTHLEELVLNIVPDEFPPLPHSIRHLACLSDIPASAADAIVHALRNLPNLDLVTATRSAACLGLDNACRGLGVDFVVHRDATYFPRASNLDWI